MSANLSGRDPSIRYSEAFKMEVVRELESSGAPFAQMRRKYGIKGAGTVENWVRRYGNGTRGKRLIMQTPQEVNELDALRQAGAPPQGSFGRRPRGPGAGAGLYPSGLPARGHRGCGGL